VIRREEVPAFLDHVAGRREIQRLLKGDQNEPDQRDLVSALQATDRLALEFDLAFGNRIYITRAGVSDYRAVFVPCGADDEDLQGPRSIATGVIQFYNDFAPVAPVDVATTPLGQTSENTTAETDAAITSGADA
jgi:hypothetical protein